MSFLVDDVESHRIVNVASVPQRSPFRYPGGKTWLVPDVRDWFRHRDRQPRELIEIFAGGGIVGLTAAFEKLAAHVTLVELDPDVAAVWQTILSDDAEWLSERIVSFELTEQSAQEIVTSTPASTRERAFSTILRNRINHGGILAPGSGILKFGENGKGIHSRWYASTLARRIRNIHSVRHLISFIEGDGLKVMEQRASDPDVTFFIDPPYTAGGKRAGKRLYTYNELDHEGLFSLAESVRGDFLMTYDQAEEIELLAKKHGFDRRGSWRIADYECP